MNKKSIIDIPGEVLKEMEEIQIHGGTGSYDDFNDGCTVNTNCDGANCTTECACEDPDLP